MASLELDPASGRYRVRFRYGGQPYKRSLRTKQRRVAMGTLAQVEESLRLLRLGMTELPPRVEPGDFIVSGARSRREMLPQSPARTLADLFSIYQKELPPGAKEKRTLEGELLHTKHLLRHLKPKTRTATLSAGAVQKYVELRSKDKYRGKHVGPETIKKEISTFRLVWNWAKKQGYLDRPAPVDQLIFPKRNEKPPFMTMGEIERLVERTGISGKQASEIWESLYLTGEEIEGLLEHVSNQQAESFVYPMFVLTAHTGMRRSELVRSEVSDFDFEGRTILVREKKRSRKHALSFRRVPMSGLIEKVFRKYFSECPSKGYSLSRLNDAVLSEDTATNHFKSVLTGSRWRKVRGFHVLRHSFASNAAAKGIDQRMIDEWMGHQTEEMRRRYRHLAPSHQRAAIDTVFCNRGRVS